MLTNLYTTIIFLVLAVFVERNLGQGRLEALRTTHHDRTHVKKTEAAKTFESDGKQGKQMNRAIRANAKRHFGLKHSKSSKSRTKKHHKMSMKEVDEILAITNNEDFTKKVHQMMKDDDSDVLKDIDEDENPTIFLNMQQGLSKFQSKTSGKKSDSSKTRKRMKNSKRSSISLPPFDTTNWNAVGYDFQNSNQWQESPTSLQSSALQSSPAQVQQIQHSIPTQELPQSPQPEILQSQESVLSQQTLPSLVHNASEGSDIDSTNGIESKQMLSKASRVCKPGPPLASNKQLPNCLLIGDSITLGSSYSVAAALESKCTVQVAPFSKGGAALDSRYGLECMKFLLSTTNLSPTRYDAVVFNFGMHDIDFSNLFPEEFNDEESYKKNLEKIKKIILKTGAGVAFSLTTPVAYNKAKNDLVINYNRIAKSIMA